ncbi:ADP-ribose diphosphatase [Fusarium oxysporum]|nr:ADP-ribose diphosphatase [Fusarium oxysporum]
MSVFDAKVTSTEPLSKEEARWIKLSKITYRDPTGTSRTWESAERLTRPKTADIDGVGIVAILPPPHRPRTHTPKTIPPSHQRRNNRSTSRSNRRGRNTRRMRHPRTPRGNRLRRRRYRDVAHDV